MKTVQGKKLEKKPDISINHDLSKYEDVVLFPEKLAKANAMLKKSGPPKLPEKKKA